jgi:hypothetical protein
VAAELVSPIFPLEDPDGGRAGRGTRTHAGALYRILRSAGQRGGFYRGGAGPVSLTPGGALRTDQGNSHRPYAMMRI